MVGRQISDRDRLVCVEGEWLLDQDVLAVREREGRGREVMTVRRRDVDDVDLGVGGELLIRSVSPGDAVGRRELLRRLEPTGADGADGAAGRVQIGGEGVRDATGGQDSPSKSGHVPSLSAARVDRI